jgi:hypothetical protein
MTRVLTDIDLDEIELSPEATKVIEWRKEWLRAAGYTKRNSSLIASSSTIDYRYACDMLKHSRDEELCMRILF